MHGQPVTQFRKPGQQIWKLTTSLRNLKNLRRAIRPDESFNALIERNVLFGLLRSESSGTKTPPPCQKLKAIQTRCTVRARWVRRRLAEETPTGILPKSGKGNRVGIEGPLTRSSSETAGRSYSQKLQKECGFSAPAAKEMHTTLDMTSLLAI